MSIIGDRILVQGHGSTHGKWFEGGVHFVRKMDVGLCFAPSFRSQHRGQPYKVHFKLNRYPIRRQHQALDTAFAEDRVLFPTQAHVRGARPRPADIKLALFNRLLVTNPPQLQAITSIVCQPPGSLPFALFGP
jgi:helicase MOV-10